MPISTPSAQAVVATSKDIPIVYAGITDPIGAKLVSSWDASGTNVTGMSNQMDVQPELDLMRELIPDLKAIGYVFSPGEVNSVTVLNQLREKPPATTSKLWTCQHKPHLTC